MLYQNKKEIYIKPYILILFVIDIEEDNQKNSCKYKLTGIV